MGYTVIPEDFAWCEENKSGHNYDSGSDDENDIDNRADEQEIIATDTTDTITLSELYQLCSSSSISKEAFHSYNKDTVDIGISNLTTLMVEEGEFSLKQFNTALFQLGEKQIQSYLVHTRSNRICYTSEHQVQVN